MSQDGNFGQSATNGNISNGNSRTRNTPDREEEGEDGGKQNIYWGGGGMVNKIISQSEGERVSP